MRTLVLAAAGTWAGAAAGLLLSANGRTDLLVGCGLALMPMSLLTPLRARGALPLVVLAAAAAVVAVVRVAPLVAGDLATAAGDGAVVTAEVVLRGDPVTRVGRVDRGVRGSARVVAAADLVVWRRAGVTRRDALPVRVAWPAGDAADTAAPGTTLRVRGRLGPDDPLRRSAAYLAAYELQLVAPAPALQQGAQALRGSLRTAAATVGGDGGGLLPGLVLGDTSLVPPDLEQAMRDAGLAHLTAVSGGNVAITLAVVWWIARRVGLRRRGLLAVAAIVLPGYVVLVRPEPSVVRAAAMAAVALLALSAGRRAYGPASLAVTVVALLLLDPFLSVSVGFALSVLATGALVVVAHRRRETVRTDRTRCAAARDAALAAAAASAATVPLVAAIGGGVPLLSVPANLLALPAVAAASVLGLLAAAAGLLLPATGVVLAHAGAVPAGWIAAVARRCSELPGAVLAWPTGVTGALSATVVVLLAGLAWWLAVRTGRTVLVGSTAALLVAGVLVAPATGVRVPFGAWPPTGWVLVACDVGQGDGLVLSTGTGSAVVVDTGPDPRRIARCLTRLGVRRVPVLVLSHDHADHVEGLPGVLQSGRSVGQVVVSPSPEPVGEAARVRDWADAAGVPVRTAVAGEVTTVGPISWTVLWPERAVLGTDADANNSSLVLLVRTHGVTVLLTGDVEPEAQAPLLLSRPPGPVDVVKVPHHGSANQDPRLAELTRPAVALVSCGVDNDYGHPAAVTLQAYASLGSVVGRTDTMGDLAVVLDAHGAPVLIARGAG